MHCASSLSARCTGCTHAHRPSCASPQLPVTLGHRLDDAFLTPTHLPCAWFQAGNGLANIADLSATFKRAQRATSTPHRPRDVFGRCVSASPPLDCACYVPAELRPLLVIHQLTWRCVPDLRLRRTFKVRIDHLWLLNLHISYSQCCPAPSCSASRSRPPQTSPPHACINLGILLLRYSSSSSGMWVLGGCGCVWLWVEMCRVVHAGEHR